MATRKQRLATWDAEAPKGVIPPKILRMFVHGSTPYIAGTTDDPEWASRLPYGATERYIVLVCPDCGADKAFPESEFAK